MQIHGLDTEAAPASLNTTAAGLSVPEPLRRRAEFGPNHVEELGRESVVLSFAREFTHFFATILWVGAALAILAERARAKRMRAAHAAFANGRMGAAATPARFVRAMFAVEGQPFGNPPRDL